MRIKAISLTPKDPFRYYARALAYMDQQKYTLAVADLTKAISYKKDYPDFFLYRAHANRFLEKNSAALADYQKYLSRRKKTPEIALFMAQCYIQNYQYEQARNELDAILADNQSAPDPYFWYGRIYHNQGLLDEAVSYYSKAINRASDFASAYRYRASAFKDMGELEAAAEDYSVLVSLTPEPIFYNRRGLVYEEMNLWEPALADYNKTIELSPKWPIAYTNRGYIYLKQKKYDLARKDFEKAISLDNSLPTPHVNMAGAYWLDKKDRKQVYRYLEQALKRGFRDIDSLYDEQKKVGCLRTLIAAQNFVRCYIDKCWSNSPKNR